MMQRVQETYSGYQLLILLAIHQNIPCINYYHTGNKYKAFKSVILWECPQPQLGKKSGTNILLL